MASKNNSKKGSGKSTSRRVFDDEWTDDYAFYVTDEKEPHPICLICNKPVKQMKVYDIKRHHESVHPNWQTQYPPGSEVS